LATVLQTARKVGILKVRFPSGQGLFEFVGEFIDRTTGATIRTVSFEMNTARYTFHETTRAEKVGDVDNVTETMVRIRIKIGGRSGGRLPKP